MSEQKYIVNDNALGFAGGCARKGELVTAEKVGVDNLNRLIAGGHISPHYPTPPPVVGEAGPEVFAASSPVDTSDQEPEKTTEDETATIAQRLSRGLPIDESKELTDEEADYIGDLKAGVKPIPFDEVAILKLNLKQIAGRVKGLGSDATVDLKGRKADASAILKTAVEEYVARVEVPEADDSEE